MSILVTGATGKVGQHLVKILAAKGAKFTCLVRDVAKASATLGSSVAVVAGDIHDLESFKKACAGHERLFLVTNEQPLEKGLVEAAAAAGVKHVVRISCFFASAGADLGTIFHAHGLAELDLRNPPIPVTHLRPGDFFQNVLTSLGTITGPASARYHALSANTRVASIDAFDIANSAAAVLTGPIELWANVALTLTGPEALSPQEYADRLSKLVGKEVKSVEIDDASLYKTLLSYHLPQRYAFALMQLQQEYRLRLTNNYFVTGSVEILTGQKPRTFEQFLLENKAAFGVK